MLQIILNKIKNTLEPQIGEYKGGFCPNRSCSNHILTLKQIMEYFKQRSKQLFIAFIDFKKVYDCVHRKTLLKILRNYGLYPKLVNITGLTLKNSESKVKFEGEISKPYPIRTGLNKAISFHHYYST